MGAVLSRIYLQCFFWIVSKLMICWGNFVTTTENAGRKVTIKVLGSGMVVNVSDCSLLCYRDYLQIVKPAQNTNINVTTTNQKLFITIKCINRYHSCLSNMKWTLFFSKSSINLCRSLLHYSPTTARENVWLDNLWWQKITEAFPNTKSIVNSEHHPCHSKSFVKRRNV